MVADSNDFGKLKGLKEEPLGAGSCPDNGVVWVAYVMMLLELLQASQFRFSEFCTPTKAVPDTPLAKMVAKLAAEKKKAVDEKQSEATSSLKEEKEKIILNVWVDDDQHSSSLKSEMMDDAVYYGDPVEAAEKSGQQPAEGENSRSLRMLVYGLLSKSLPHHQYLVTMCVPGDFARLFTLAKKVALKQSTRSFIGAVQKMAALRKDSSTPWTQLSAMIMEVHSTLKGIKDGDFAMGNRVLTEFVLNAMDSDPTSGD
jgi:hypothetical protein